jgi:hypothetical protein
VTDAGLAELRPLRRLEALDLSYCPVTDPSPLAALPELRRLNLSATRVTDASLASVARLKALRELDLTHTGVSRLSGLSGAVGLEVLHLPQTHRLSPAALREVERLPRLHRLGVETTHPTADLRRARPALRIGR